MIELDKKKSKINIFILFFFSFFAFNIIFYINKYLFNLTAFINSVITIFLVTSLLFLLMNVLPYLKIKLLIIFTIAQFLLIYSIFGPIFVDRSVSYHIVEISEDANGISFQEIKRSSDRMIKKRLEEMVNLGLVVEVDGRYFPTKKGKVFNFFVKRIEKLSGYENEYYVFKQSVLNLQ